MSRSSRYSFTSMVCALVAAALQVTSLKLPLWHLKMESPQYQGTEALRVQVYPGSMRGDLREISVLNKYIGVRIPENLPQLRWLPVALLAGAALGLMVLALPRVARARAWFTIATLLSLAMLISAATAQWQMRRIGHERDPHAALVGVGNFTPPILGQVKVANFEITTGLGVGALLIGAGILLQVGAGFASRRRRPACGRGEEPCSTSVRANPGAVV
jgi:copper chaperone NosL